MPRVSAIDLSCQDLLRRGLFQNAAITAISKEAIEEVAIDQDHDGQDAVCGHR